MQAADLDHAVKSDPCPAHVWHMALCDRDSVYLPSAKGSLVPAQNKVVVLLALPSISMLCAWGQPPAMHEELYCG